MLRKVFTEEDSAWVNINEATMVFTKKYFNSMPGFMSSSQGEGCKMVDHNDKNVEITNISDIMICVCHQNNTLSKDRFIENKINVNIKNLEQLIILKDILKDEENLNPNEEDFVWIDSDDDS